MNIRLVVALVGLAIGLAVPTFAQQKDAADPLIRQQLEALGQKYDEAFNNGDAVALAALYTEDGIEVTNTGPVYGREAIEKYYADLFQKFHFRNHVTKADQNSPHVIDTAGNEDWSNGECSTSIQRQNFGPIYSKGYAGIIVFDCSG